MKIKVSELSGAALDWAVSEAVDVPVVRRSGGMHCEIALINVNDNKLWSPSTDWSQGGPLIERFGIMLVNPESDDGYWEASPQDNPEWQDGDTPLIAACRAIIMGKTGNEVEIPERLAP